MDHEFAKFFEAVVIKKKLDPFAGSHFSGGVLLFNAGSAAALLRGALFFFQNFEFGS